MKMVVGLGNLGKEYRETRHNVGFIVLDKLAERLDVPQFESNSKFKSDISRTTKLVLAKPQTFMNTSGDAVAALASFYKISPEQIYVVHDDLDIKLGYYKLHFGKGPKQHNGVVSVEASLGSKEFWRMRVGVENRVSLSSLRDKKLHITGEEYVLQTFPSDELEIIHRVEDQVVQDLVRAISGNGVA